MSKLNVVVKSLWNLSTHQTLFLNFRVLLISTSNSFHIHLNHVLRDFYYVVRRKTDVRPPDKLKITYVLAFLTERGGNAVQVTTQLYKHFCFISSLRFLPVVLLFVNSKFCGMWFPVNFVRNLGSMSSSQKLESINWQE